MVTRSTILQTLPAFENKTELLEENQGVRDIIKGMKAWHTKFAADYDLICKYFIGSTPKQTCRNIFDFLKSNCKYVVEGLDCQTVRGPAAIVATGNTQGIDCKNYSLFAGGILDAINRTGKQNIPFVYRFASYDMFNEDAEHVFITAFPGGKEIWIDPVLKTFDQREPAPYHILDKKFSAMALNGISGTPTGSVNGGIATLAAGKARAAELAALLPEIAPYCIYLYVDWQGSSLKPAVGRRTIITNNSDIPAAVTGKVEKLYKTLWDFGHQTGQSLDSTVFGPLRGYVTSFLGKDPADWWKDVAGTGGVSRIGVAPLVAAGAVVGAFDTPAVKNILNKLFGGLKLTYQVDEWLPAPTDWQGSKLQPFAVAPLKPSGMTNTITAGNTGGGWLNAGAGLLDNLLNNGGGSSGSTRTNAGGEPDDNNGQPVSAGMDLTIPLLIGGGYLLLKK